MTDITHISRQQARRFLLLKHGLIDRIVLSDRRVFWILLIRRAAFNLID
jgi:hypothetical protein